MPFTPIHSLASLPIRAILPWLPLTGIVVGTAVPDLPMFFPVADYAQTHSWWGTVFICLPWGLAFWFLFEFLLRNPFIDLLEAWLPSDLRNRMPRFPISSKRRSWRVELGSIVLVTTGIWCGAATHLVWDAFTHEGRWGVMLLPMLEDDWEIGPWNLPGYKLAQYGSTLIGFPLLVFIGVRWLRRLPKQVPSDCPFTIGFRRICCGLGMTVLLAVVVYAFLTNDGIAESLGMAIRRSGAVAGVGWLIYSVVSVSLASRRDHGGAKFDEAKQTKR